MKRSTLPFAWAEASAKKAPRIVAATLAESVGVVKRPRPASEVRRPLASGLIRYGANLMDNFRLQVPRNTLSNGLVRISSVNGSAAATEEGQDCPEGMAFS